MAPKTRAPPKARQSTLSFNSKVTKPSRSTSNNLKKLADTSFTAQPEPEQPFVHAIELSAQEKPLDKLAPADDEEATARKIKPMGIRKYYSSILKGRLSTPVHQTTLTLEEKVLRHFDLSSQYGPCIGITRVDRWKRANKLGLKPPVEVLAVALLMEDEGGKTSGEEENRDTRKAYIDDFLPTKSAGV